MQNNFGLGFGSSYNGVTGDIAISSAHPIFAGVDHLYQNNGNDALDIDVTSPYAEVLASYGNHGLYAVYNNTAGVPEPATLALFGLGLLAFGVKRRATN